MVSIGVSGHRNLSNSDELNNAIDDVLKKITNAFSAKSVQIISPLAEGADRIVAWRVINQYPHSLVVPLPMKKSEYILDFDTPASKEEFISLLGMADQVIDLPPQTSRALSYQSAGLYILDHCDVLIALWDGAPAKGLGGTAEIVAEARKRRIPVAWLHIADKIYINYERFPNILNEEQGEL
jgi:hypothetical protein